MQAGELANKGCPLLPSTPMAQPPNPTHLTKGVGGGFAGLHGISERGSSSCLLTVCVCTVDAKCVHASYSSCETEMAAPFRGICTLRNWPVIVKDLADLRCLTVSCVKCVSLEPRCPGQ